MLLVLVFSGIADCTFCPKCLAGSLSKQINEMSKSRVCCRFDLPFYLLRNVVFAFLVTHLFVGVFFFLILDDCLLLRLVYDATKAH